MYNSFQSVKIFSSTSEFEHLIGYVLPVCVSSLPGHVLLHLYGGSCHISVVCSSFLSYLLHVLFAYLLL